MTNEIETTAFIGARIKSSIKEVLQKEADRKFRGNLSALLEAMMVSKVKQIERRVDSVKTK